ncbi:hypothetical protein BX666DRAFT_181547 [Dichotomocladium elegans]|nr:hypothetical protein BX666DRAFT_181547 [Dichotomocladium elegans]
MDSMSPEDTGCVLPPARELLLHIQDHSAQSPDDAKENGSDKMQIDDPYESSDSADRLTVQGNLFLVLSGQRRLILNNNPGAVTKPHLPSLTNVQPCSPIPHTSSPSHTQDEYLRHRMSDMSVSVLPHSNSGLSPPPSIGHEVTMNRTLSPLEPGNTQQQFESYSRRGSITDFMHHPTAPPLDFRRPSITDLNNLPLPSTASASASRRGSMATVITEYDYPSRSPSPSPYKASLRSTHDIDYTPVSSIGGSSGIRRDSLPHPGAYDPFQRRHSIATAEAPNSRLAATKYRGNMGIVS